MSNGNRMSDITAKQGLLDLREQGPRAVLAEFRLRIEALRTEAQLAGDAVTDVNCYDALSGDESALAEVLSFLAETEAQYG